MSDEDNDDYDKAAAELFKDLGIDVTDPGEDDLVNPVYQHPAGGWLYVGDQRAAKNITLLNNLNIVAVVNCTHNTNNYFPDKLSYCKFPVGKWKTECKGGEVGEVKRFVESLLMFLQTNLETGGSVLLHCLAGAHRAGTAAVLAIMAFKQMSVSQVGCCTYFTIIQ